VNLDAGVEDGRSKGEPKVYARARVWHNEPGLELQRIFDEYFSRGWLNNVLDAGAGYKLPLDIPLDVNLAAIDISEEALAKNENADTKIVGNLETYEFEPQFFDAIICWWVLEHVQNRRAVLANLADALRQDGLLIVAIPYVWGMKTAVTKLTPYSFHIWVARRFDPVAGTPGSPPYRTYLSSDLSPRRLQRLAAEYDLEPFHTRSYSAEPESMLPRPLRLIWKTIGTSIRVATFGRYDPLLSEYLVVFRKR
jgi:SAM-dependent methyltransferase